MERYRESKAWQVLLVSLPALASVEGGKAESDPQGVLTMPMPDTDYLKTLLS